MELFVTYLPYQYIPPFLTEKTVIFCRTIKFHLNFLFHVRGGYLWCFNKNRGKVIDKRVNDYCQDIYMYKSVNCFEKVFELNGTNQYKKFGMYP